MIKLPEMFISWSFSRNIACLLDYVTWIDFVLVVDVIFYVLMHRDVDTDDSELIYTYWNLIMYC